MKTLRPVNKIAEKLNETGLFEWVKTDDWCLGKLIEIQTKRRGIVMVASFCRKPDRPICEITYYWLPRSEWRLSDDDCVREIEDKRFNFSALTSDQVVDEIIKAVPQW
ncbi:hypothetical protein [Bifidobacterium aerophilum]|uniref:Uncharacterized protein n=1 Tax=Bifidobacterium aerophilum TaxID=1798155 RepID=A0A6N9Z5D7_9BIFI|nr:hypothetical protein [Bifidobacterium aerophilum]NEG89852.1 hypothetical protein [Bifidobacterium aerophilum]